MTGTVAEPSGGPAAERIGPMDVVASCVLLFALAVAQPLLDLLGRNAEFFLAQNTPTLDIVILAIALTVVIPLALSGLAVGVGRIHPVSGEMLHGVIVGVLGALLAVQVLRRTPLDALSGWVQVGVAGVAGVALVVGYRRSAAFRSVLRWGTPVPLLILGLFLFGSATSQLVIGSPAGAASAPVAVADPAPIVFLIFDEFPVSSLMDGEGNLQEDLYPNFARLAVDGTWYRNAVTVRHQTEVSVPAILTGLETSPDALPILGDHPDNLFTLLDDHYEVEATELFTRLCPNAECRSADDLADRRRLTRRWRSLLSDLRVVAGHLFLPTDLARDLPAIDDAWANFAADAEADIARDGRPGDDGAGSPARDRFGASVSHDRRRQVVEFLSGIESPGAEPPLYFLHTLLPHAPWTYLPSGQLMDVPTDLPGSGEDGWVDDAWLVDQGYQLHLLQAQYVDTLIGDVIDRLEGLGMYEETLIVVVSDHGAIFRPALPRRASTPETIGDIAPIPLFIKAPHQQTGGIDDYRAHTTDILPTIADILDSELPWESDGMSLVGDERPERTHSEITGDDGGVIELGTDGGEARDRAADKVARFGSEGPFGLAPPGYADLLGRGVETLAVAGAARIRAELYEPERFADVDLSADVLPVSIRGRLEGAADASVVIAVAVDDDIVALTRSYHDDDEARFDAVLPPDVLEEGANEIELFLVAGEPPGATLHPIDG